MIKCSNPHVNVFCNFVVTLLCSYYSKSLNKKPQLLFWYIKHINLMNHTFHRNYFLNDSTHNLIYVSMRGRVNKNVKDNGNNIRKNGRNKIMAHILDCSK